MSRNEHEAHDLLLSIAERQQRMRAGFAVQGPYPRRQRARVWRWLLAFIAVGALIRAAIGAMS
jgi:hypothetical protein